MTLGVLSSPGPKHLQHNKLYLHLSFHLYLYFSFHIYLRTSTIAACSQVLPTSQNTSNLASSGARTTWDRASQAKSR